MPVEIFTKEQFEAALPSVPRTAEFSLGARQYIWTFPVANGMAIRVYSGIGTSGVSADCGEDSIRAVIIRMSDGRVYGSKLKRWVTRQPGWRTRLIDMLRDMWKLALLTGPCTNKIMHEKGWTRPEDMTACKGTVGVYLVRKEGKNKGRMFRKCDSCLLYEWLMKDDKGALRREAA